LRFFRNPLHCDPRFDRHFAKQNGEKSNGTPFD